MAVSTSSYDVVLDALIAMLRALPSTSGNPPVAVYDGPPGPNEPDLFVSIAGNGETIGGPQEWASLGGTTGAPARDEHYVIDGFVFSIVGGDNVSGVTGISDAQKSARDAAYVIFHDFESALRLDPKLSGTLRDGWAGIADHRLVQTDPEDPKSQMGRYVVLTFQVGVTNRLHSV